MIADRIASFTGSGGIASSPSALSACLAGARVPLLSAVTLTASSQHGHFFHLLMSFGLIGLFLVSVVDSSFVPLPIPGVSDLMILFFAAQRADLLLLVSVATVGSALGGYVSFQVGHSGGMQFLEKHVPKRIFERVCRWMERHALLSVALPALLPPPMPLSPFVLAAGALKMSKRRFMSVFTTSRLLRHIVAAWLGVHFGPQVLSLWNRFSDRWANTILVAVWIIIAVSGSFAAWRLYRTSKDLKKGKPRPAESMPSASAG